MSALLAKPSRWAQKVWKRIKRWVSWHLLYWSILVIRWVVNHIPEKLAYGLGDLLAAIWYRFSPRNKKLTYHNLKSAFPEWNPAQQRRVAQKVFRNLIRSSFELFRFTGGKYPLEHYIYFEELDRLRRACESDKGVIAVSAHLGNWELLACAVSAQGFPVRVVANRIRDFQVNQLIQESRSAAGVPVIFRDEPIAHMLRALRNREILAILIDQDSRYDGIFVNHFNMPTFTARGPALLALVTGAPIVPIFITRNKEGNHRVFVEEPIEVNPAADREQEIYRITQCCMDIVEGYIRRFPDQWVWMHRRWKTRPENALQLDGQLHTGRKDLTF